MPKNAIVIFARKSDAIVLGNFIIIIRIIKRSHAFSICTHMQRESIICSFQQNHSSKSQITNE